MLRRTRFILAVALLSVLAGSLISSGRIWAGAHGPSPVPAVVPVSDGQKTAGIPAAPPPTPDQNLGSAEDYTKKLLLMMDTDKNGMVSKKEFMTFMSAEFDRLDVNHDGQLDVKELAAIHVRPYLGK